jgi:hypothetical protein
MKRLAWGLFLFAAGCGNRMCQSPWDYAGPVQGSPAIPYAGTTTRSGSVLNDGPIAAAPTSAAPDVPNPPTTPKNLQGPPSDPLTMRPGSTSALRR